MDIMSKIRKKAKTEEFDHLFLMDCLSIYKQPKDKLSKLIKANKLIRVKKGIYVFGKEYQQRPYSLEVLANLIYGPSYVSFEYALSYYNLIPEKVVRITSACSKKIKNFSTPVGDFIYYYIAPKKFPSGIKLESVDKNTNFLIATKEKALFDYLIEGIRIDQNDLFNFKKALIQEISENYKNKNVDLLCKILKK